VDQLKTECGRRIHRIHERIKISAFVNINFRSNTDTIRVHACCECVAHNTRTIWKRIISCLGWSCYLIMTQIVIQFIKKFSFSWTDWIYMKIRVFRFVQQHVFWIGPSKILLFLRLLLVIINNNNKIIVIFGGQFTLHLNEHFSFLQLQNIEKMVINWKRKMIAPHNSIE